MNKLMKLVIKVFVLPTFLFSLAPIASAGGGGAAGGGLLKTNEQLLKWVENLTFETGLQVVPDEKFIGLMGAMDWTAEASQETNYWPTYTPESVYVKDGVSAISMWDSVNQKYIYVISEGQKARVNNYDELFKALESQQINYNLKP